MVGRNKKPEFSQIKSKKVNAKIAGSIKIDDRKIKTIFMSEGKSFSKSGGYIPSSQDYDGHKVYVIVMEDKV